MSKSPTRQAPSARPPTRKHPSTVPSTPVPTTPPRRQTHLGRVGRFRSRHRVVAALVPVLVVVVAVATMVVVKVSGSPGSPAGPAGGTAGSASGPSATGSGTTPLPSSVVKALSVAPSTLDAVGTPASVSQPVRVAGAAVARGADGKALVTYIGAEYCPYCAAERWAIAVALSRFGTFSQLSGTHSSGTDVYPDTQTLSFYGSSYTSAYLDFRSVEETTNQRSGSGYRPLQEQAPELNQ